MAIDKMVKLYGDKNWHVRLKTIKLCQNRDDELLSLIEQFYKDRDRAVSFSQYKHLL